MGIEKGIDFRSLEAAENECLTVILAPSINRPHPQPREINSMRFFGLEMKVFNDMLCVHE